MQELGSVRWQRAEVASPRIDGPVSVVAAKDVPYAQNANRFQNLSIYLPETKDSLGLVDTPVASLPVQQTSPRHLPRWHVHIHGGAWRDPQLTSSSIEATVAHAFSSPASLPLLDAIVSINYTLSPFPTHPTLAYDPSRGDPSDPSRDAKHPEHIRDVLSAFALLHSLGLRDHSYLLSGHSAGACLSFQSILQAPGYWGLEGTPEPPRPVALLGLNGLYSLPALVYGLEESHAQLEDVYVTLLSIAFGSDQTRWVKASPAYFDRAELVERMKDGKLPRLVLLDQSEEDQLVPMNQADTFETHLKAVGTWRVIRGNRCKGLHAAPWEQGYMIWDSIQDVLQALGE
jgi:kynurenine formamidase